MTTPDNPPAFPNLTLRDYFAAKAMQALIRNYSVKEEFDAFVTQAKDKGMSLPQLFAAMAYENAQAMLTERNRRAEA